MAKNKVNNGLFDVSDLAENTQKQIDKINAQEPAPARKPKAKTERRTIKRETKSKRVSLLMRPSDYESLVNMAEDEGVSVNDLINRILIDNIK